MLQEAVADHAPRVHVHGDPIRVAAFLVHEDHSGSNVRNSAIPAPPPPVASETKQDARPARVGCQPGPLIKGFVTCDKKFVGGLEASTCADCAYGRPTEAA